MTTWLPFAAGALLAGWLLLADAAGAASDDPRLVFSGDSHAWLRAVGRLQVPGQRFRGGHAQHYIEDCSATLVALPGRDRADTLLTAWHCLEWYGDLSRPIRFTIVTASGEAVEREAYRLQDGGGMHADWAILRLHQPLPAQAVSALRVFTQGADAGQPVTMAGYSRDAGLGSDGRALTFDPACAIIALTAELGDTDCTAYKGASGGAVVQLSADGEPGVSGIISQGDGEGRSTFVPVSSFRHAIDRHLR